jgi:cytochrome P450
MEIDKQQHAMRRRFLAPAFSERALKEAERLITASALKLTEGLSKLPEGAQKGDWASPHNMGRWATFFGFDFIADLGYGRPFGMLENNENRWVPDVLKGASIFIYYVGYLPFIDLVRPLMGSCIAWISKNSTRPKAKTSRSSARTPSTTSSTAKTP